MFPDYFSPFPLKPLIPTHLSLDIVWKVVEWLFKILFQAIDFLESWEQQGHCAVAAPGSRWWHWCQLLRGTRLLLSDVCGDEWFYTQKNLPVQSVTLLHIHFIPHNIQPLLLQLPESFCHYKNFIYIISFLSLTSALIWLLEGNKLREQLRLFQQHWHKGCTGARGTALGRTVTSHLPCHCQELLPWYKVLQKWAWTAPWAGTNPLQRGWSWSCRAKCAGVTHVQLCLVPTKTTSGRGGKAAVRWQGWAVRALILLWVSGQLRKWNATLKNHLWGRQGQGTPHFPINMVFQPLWLQDIYFL